jgi:hypothetical protein|tara:strand:+ start:73 stop:285 length:213 start_codon:yes stop_codon:yes gene_type:complete
MGRFVIKWGRGYLMLIYIILLFSLSFAIGYVIMSLALKDNQTTGIILLKSGNPDFYLLEKNVTEKRPKKK